MTKDEALKLSLEALESCDAAHITDGGRQWYDEKLVDKSITAIKEALAQPEQEPVAWIDKMVIDVPNQLFYTAPPHRKPLTDEEIQDLLMPVRISGDGYYLRIARAIEAAHGIKGGA